MSVSIQENDFDLAAELAALRSGSSKVGALVSFVGLVRDFSNDGKVENIFLEHYPGMTEKALNKIIGEATVRWNLLGTRVIHRVGTLRPNDQIVLVATAAQHRGEAFAACEFIIDYLKTAAPFWKKEQTGQGAQWLETRDSDMQRMEHWRSHAEGKTS
ncbi:MAG: molybdenum cofactor biosynthesis protein MoaE [Nitrosomonadales bacterium]|nr:molybdenum cofactor biosynthesis protein MoaE [Nitrosomonadales bacterium]